MTTNLPDVLGVSVIDDLNRAAEQVTARPDAAMDIAWPAIERGMFRLAGLTLSHWLANGRHDAAQLPLRREGGSLLGLLALGSAVSTIAFCNMRAPLMPAEKLIVPQVNRFKATVEGVAAATAGVAGDRLRSPRFDLVRAVEGCKWSDRKSTSLAGALEPFVRLRNLEAHHAGREQEWVVGHPDYARIFAPLLIEAAWDLFGNAEVGVSLRGLCVATVVQRAPSRRGRPALTTFAPDHPAVQRAYSETAVEVAEGGEVVLDLGTGPTSARVVAPFVNLAQGIPSSLAALLADEPG